MKTKIPTPGSISPALIVALLLARLLTPATVSATPARLRELSLEVGEQTSLSAEGVESYSEGAGGIVEVRLPKNGGQFVLLALKPGQTSLLLLMLDGSEVHYRLTVHDAAPKETGIRVRTEDNIRLDLYFVQVSETRGHQLGVAWPDRVGGGQLEAGLDLKTGALTSASLGIADQVLPRLDLAERGGYARVRRHAAVVAENGKQASFDSGGEINVPIQGALTAEVRAIEFGSRVTLSPRFDAGTGRLELAVGATVADLTDDNGSGIPGRNVSKLETVVNLDLGKSLVVAGLDAASEARSRRGLPGLGRIPILGGLFASHGARRELTKNLLIIVPSVVQAVDRQKRALVSELFRAYETFEGSVRTAPVPLAGAGAEEPGQ